MISNHLQFHDKELNGLHPLWRGERGLKAAQSKAKCAQDRNLTRHKRKKVESPQKVSNSLRSVCEPGKINEDIMLPNPTDVSLKENRQSNLGPLK